MSEIMPGYWWDAKTSRYMNLSTGLYVSREQVFELADEMIEDSKKKMGNLAREHNEDNLSATLLALAVAIILSGLALQLRALGRGGFDLLLPMDFTAIERRLRDNYTRLFNHLTATEDGAVRPSLGQLMNRMRMYVGNTRSEFWEADRLSSRVSDASMILLERRITTANESCEDCIRFYEMGWQIAGTLPLPGNESACLSNCLCLMDHMEVPYAEVEEWIGTKN